ncbi:BQ5605_C009g05726 [Microbotryum silenes-dioicae]|uniref:BQ5605_C009g05726 protein n=1 Tax=Microbotryum silenes-dioicae TaxID=796604 RepID=A0A2X0N0W8_9BASI|nr:BQ5605_C009g05726 [Microbotryum silenes-dioicae]
MNWSVEGLGSAIVKIFKQPSFTRTPHPRHHGTLSECHLSSRDITVPPSDATSHPRHHGTLSGCHLSSEPLIRDIMVPSPDANYLPGTLRLPPDANNVRTNHSTYVPARQIEDRYPVAGVVSPSS